MVTTFVLIASTCSHHAVDTGVTPTYAATILHVATPTATPAPTPDLSWMAAQWEEVNKNPNMHYPAVAD